MPENNHKCIVCGNPYYCCNAAEKIGSWRKNFCSPDCFQNYLDRVAARDAGTTVEARTKVEAEVEQEFRAVQDAVTVTATPTAKKRRSKNTDGE